MRAVFGLLLVMLGLAMAIVWMPEHDSEHQLAVVTDIATQGTARRPDTADRGGRTFSPNTPLIASVEQPGSSQPQHIAGVARIVRTAPGGDTAAPAEIVRMQPSNTTVVAQSVAGATVVAQAVADVVATTRTPALTETSRYELVRNLQRELKRVSCYAGDIDGDWGTGSRRAMAAFTDRVNASLPIEQPDFILLTLVQGHQGAICGEGCPTGQTQSDNGRCVSGAVVAQVRRTQDRRNATTSNDVVHYATTHTATAQAAADPAATETGWTTQVTRAPSGGAVAQSNVAPSNLAPAAIVGAVAVAAAVAPLPGRMSMGGPQATAPSVSAPALERSPARAAVRGSVSQIEDAPRSVQASERRPRRVARGDGGSYRYAPVVTRAPRIVTPTYYASAPRRGRSWIGSFFGFP